MRNKKEKILKYPAPFIKWAGGKNRILDEINRFIPSGKLDYYEPFLGGGAVFFSLYRNNKIRSAHLNDCNHELINAYVTIRDNLDLLVEELARGQYQNDYPSYIKIRTSSPSDKTLQAARFIYLNRTCFNGLYRVNKKGEFNVPFGKYDNPTILNLELLKSVSRSLQDVEITCLDYKEYISTIKNPGFIYIDPPYLPIKKDSFTSYTSDGFSLSEHESLYQAYKKLVNEGNICIMSNSYCDSSLTLYKDENIISIQAGRSIGGSPDTRIRVKEILITNQSP